MTSDVSQDVAEPAVRWLKPGHLLAPLGWTAEQVAPLAQTEAALLVHLFELDRKRMHLIALVLAHHDGALTQEAARLLASAPARDVLDHVLPCRPTGVLRALGRLPDEVISPAGYRRLVKLLHEPNAAKILRHARSIDEDDLADLHALPAELRRPAVVGAFDCLNSMKGLEQALRLFVRRGVVQDFETLLSDSASLADPAQLRAKVRDLVEALPLPATLPPVELGPARRLDHAAEIRALARRWRNCLARFVDDVDRGDKAIYLWEEPRLKAACMVERHGRLGWFLRDAKGPRNRELNPTRLQRVRLAFAAADIPPDDVADSIEHLCLEDDALVCRVANWTRRREEREDPAEADEDVVAELSEAN